MSEQTELQQRVETHVSKIWREDAIDRDRLSEVADLLISAIGISGSSNATPSARWDETDIALIGYGDSIVADDSTPLAALTTLVREQLGEAFSFVHILPFSPSSSDRGFSVIDYRAVDPSIGSWDDMEALSETTDLMFDLVLNHCSSESSWFADFLDDRPPGNAYILTEDPTTDVSEVVRPRSLPLLTKFDTAAGQKHVWTTFSEDQVDLDWSNPALVAEMLRIIDLYITRGARFLRLDAVAYIWKETGTPCIHLPQTHEMVKLLHTLLDVRAPHVSIITETNVPDRENRTYFGASDEAHLIYNFTLPPLAIDGVINARADRLAQWLESTPPPPAGTTLFNFLASHDGIGVRPAEGFLTDAEIAELVAFAQDQGGLFGTYDRRGKPYPYELNISFPDLFGGPDDPHTVGRILVLHSIVLALAGVPAVYINSLMATTNDLEAVMTEGVRRSINRGRVHLDDVPVRGGSDWRSRIFDGLIELSKLRRSSSAFHPEATQRVSDLDGVLLIKRSCPDTGERVSVYCNLTSSTKSIEVDASGVDMRSGDVLSSRLALGPYASAWVRLETSNAQH